MSRAIICVWSLRSPLLALPVDALHVIAYVHRSLLAQVLLVIEDGGEMHVI